MQGRGADYEIGNRQARKTISLSDINVICCFSSHSLYCYSHTERLLTNTVRTKQRQEKHDGGGSPLPPPNPMGASPLPPPNTMGASPLPPNPMGGQAPCLLIRWGEAPCLLLIRWGASPLPPPNTMGASPLPPPNTMGGKPPAS